MLVHLSISNFAIIEHAEIAPGPGLTVMSGETGAGKSIIVNAINLILGARASTDLIRSGSSEASVEALFSLPEDAGIQDLLEEMGLPADSELLIRRTLSREGRNRIFINGATATLGMLARLGPLLVSISGQHEHQQLLKPDNHLHLLDDFAGLAADRERINAGIAEYRRLKKLASDARTALQALEERQELNRHQLNEIDKAVLKDGEEEALLQERKRLQNAGELLQVSSECYQRIYENPDSILAELSSCRKQLERTASLDSSLSPLVEALQDIDARLEDVAIGLRDFRNDIPTEPERLEQVQDRIEQIKQLKRKYGASIHDILVFRETLEGAFEDLARRREEAARLDENAGRLEARLLADAAVLSERRQAAAKAMEAQMETELQQLHMGNSRFRVAFQTPPAPGKATIPPSVELKYDGLDQTEFLLAPNIGEELRPLARIASGGELSRIMLAMKTLLARRASVETVIFDEVDAGISGATAQVVGEKLKALSKYHQALCITHLPQIASQGDTHFLVKKEPSGERTQTLIQQLDPESRIQEIARLLAGREITPHALAHAEEMLK